jgi:hypothetical protein
MISATVSLLLPACLLFAVQKTEADDILLTICFSSPAEGRGGEALLFEIRTIYRVLFHFLSEIQVSVERLIHPVDE